MNNEKFCPACGSNNLKEVTMPHFIDEAFNCQKTIELSEYQCNDCGTTGDFFDENAAKIIHELKELKQACVSGIINDFVENEISMSSMERALELPQRTLAKWKNRIAAPTASGVALLKFLRLFPWLIEVAENNYDCNISQKIFIKHAVDEFLIDYKSRGVFCGGQTENIMWHFFVKLPNELDEFKANSSEEPAINFIFDDTSYSFVLSENNG